MYDDVPIGWKRAFGKIMLEDYRKVLIRNNYLDEFQWIEVKEKYGTLRLYSYSAPEEVLDLELKYDYISRHICICCGRINVATVTDGWVELLCEDCYNKRILNERERYEKHSKDQEYIYTPYEKFAKKMREIEAIVTYKCYSPENGDYEKKCDYSDTISKIMERQKKLFKKR